MRNEWKGDFKATIVLQNIDPYLMEQVANILNNFGPDNQDELVRDACAAISLELRCSAERLRERRPDLE